MSRQPYHPVRPTRPRPGRVPKQRSAPPPRSTGGKSTGGMGCPMAIPILPALMLFVFARYLSRKVVALVPLALLFPLARYLRLPAPGEAPAAAAATARVLTAAGAGGSR